MAKVTCQRSRKEKGRLGIEILMTCCPMTPLSCCPPLCPQAHAKTKSPVQEDRNKERSVLRVMHDFQITFTPGCSVLSKQWRSWVFWRQERAMTMDAPDRNYNYLLFVAIIWNMLSAENQFIFHLRHSFCRPCRGGLQHLLPLPSYVAISKYRLYKTYHKWKISRQLFTNPRRIIAHDPKLSSL